MRVLLTEDEHELRSMLAHTLIEADYKVVEADSGDAAAGLLKGSDRFDVLVTDIHMPGRLDGLAL
jgi:CheY-like chemotaxis protein